MEEENNMTLTEHLGDLRRVLTVSIIAIFVTSIASYAAFGDQLFGLVTEPLKKFDVELIYIGMAEAFVTKIKVAILAGIILALPVILWQIWSFVAPALLPKERRYFILLIPISALLFAGGALFAYLVVFNFAARFLLVVVSGDLTPMLSVGKYVSFLIAFVLPFGAVFELPLVVYFLTKIGLINHRWLARNRKFALFGFFIIAAVLTPPDVVSQILLAGPMLVLYEIGVIIARFVKPRETMDETEVEVRQDS